MSDSVNPMNCQAPLSMGFSQQAYWSGLPFLPLGDLPDPGIKPMFPELPPLVDRFFTTESSGKCTLTPKFEKD